MSTTLTPPSPTPARPPDGPTAKPWYKRDFYIGRAVKTEEIMNFSRQMSSFLRAGVPILDSLNVVAEENASKKMKEVLADMRRRLLAGGSFGDAIAQHTRVFPGYYVAVVRAAELTGLLDEALEQLSNYLEREVEATREIKSSLTYPAIVCCFAIAAVIIMSVYVLPKFKSFYSGLGAHLPLPTRMLLGFTTFVTNWYPVIFAGFAALVIITFILFGGNQGKARRDQFLLRLPGVGDLVHLIAIERFCRVLAALVQTGVPLPDAVQVSADSTNNRLFQKKLATVREAMMRGEGLARPIERVRALPARRPPDDPRRREHRLPRRAAAERRDVLRARALVPVEAIHGHVRAGDHHHRRRDGRVRRGRADLRDVQRVPPGEDLTKGTAGHVSRPARGTFPGGPRAMKATRQKQQRVEGFTLIELLTAIVVVGVLMAIAIAGVAGLQEKGQTAACATSLQAATSATEIYYSVTGGKYPQTFHDLTNPPTGHPLLDPAPGIIQTPTTLEGKSGGWKVTLVRGATPSDLTTFTGCPAAAK